MCIRDRAQTTALALQSHGLGICYMGTTLHAMREIADFLLCPENCLPVTSLVVGWPAEAPAQRDRLSPPAWIHDEVYQRPTPEQIDARFAERERRGRERYLAPVSYTHLDVYKRQSRGLAWQTAA